MTPEVLNGNAFAPLAWVTRDARVRLSGFVMHGSYCAIMITVSEVEISLR